MRRESGSSAKRQNSFCYCCLTRSLTRSSSNSNSAQCNSFHRMESSSPRDGRVGVAWVHWLIPYGTGIPFEYLENKIVQFIDSFSSNPIFWALAGLAQQRQRCHLRQASPRKRGVIARRQDALTFFSLPIIIKAATTSFFLYPRKKSLFLVQL